MENSKKKYLLILGSFLVVLFLTVVGLFIYEYTRIKPNNVRFSNITSSSVTVSWNTKKPTSASVIAFEGDTSLPVRLFGFDKEKYYDTRDVKKAELEAIERTSEKVIEDGDYTISSNEIETEVVVTDRGDYYTHHVSVNGLDPEKEYSFMIGDEYLYRKVEDINNNIVVSTLEIPEEIKSPYPAYGFVKDAQNQTELPIDQLAVISDGIVYFNYYENTTGGRSNLFSSVLSNSGTWYIDVSSAIDEEGVPFFQAYDSVEHEFMIELTLDAGPLGVWEKKELNGSNSPTPPIIINYPSSGNDEDVSTTKISSLLDSFVQKVFAYRDPSTKPSDVDCDSTAIKLDFLNYCGPCVKKCSDGIYYGPYTCPQSTLCSRNCVDCDDPDEPGGENPITCGGYVLGTPKKYGSDCKVCSKRPSGSYYIGAWEINNKDYDPSKNCAPRVDCTPKTCAQLSNGKYVHTTCSENSEYSCSSTTYNNSNTCNTSIKCFKRVYKNGDNDCTPKTCAQLSNGKYVYTTCSENSEYSCSSKTYNNSDTCNTSIKCFKRVYKNGDNDCTPKTCSQLSNGKYVHTTCSEGSEYSCSSKTYNNSDTCNTSIKCFKRIYKNEYKSEDDIYSDESCWKGFSRGYYRIVDGVLQRCLDNGTWKDNPTSPGADRCQDLYNLDAIDNVSCNLKRDFCSIPNVSGVYTDYICDGQHWVKWEDYKKENPEEEIPAGPAQSLPYKKECSTNQCVCPDGSIISKGGLCIEVAPESCNFSNLGSICSESGNKCGVPSAVKKVFDTVKEAKQYYIGGEYGIVAVKETYKNYIGIDNKNQLIVTYTPAMPVICIPDDGNLGMSFPRLSKDVLGKTNQESTVRIIIDPQTGMISSIDPGSYLIEYKGDFYTFMVRGNNLESGEGSVMIYLDKDGNGEYDSDIDEKVSEIASEISILTLDKEYKYSFEQGLNFVSLPFLIANKEYRTAASLLEQLNNVYDNAFYSISKFDGGKWKMVGQNTELYGSNDFQLLPGIGYVFKVKQDINISIVGKPVKFESEE
ncbi:MAG: hypothetical protein XD93_0076, partial [candidate division WS6 bacterium 34_10]